MSKNILTPGEKELRKSIKKHFSLAHLTTFDLLIDMRNQLVGYLNVAKEAQKVEVDDDAED